MSRLWVGSGQMTVGITFFFPWEVWKRNRHRVARKYRERKSAAHLKARIQRYSRKRTTPSQYLVQGEKK